MKAIYVLLGAAVLAIAPDFVMAQSREKNLQTECLIQKSSYESQFPLYDAFASCLESVFEQQVHFLDGEHYTHSQKQAGDIYVLGGGEELSVKRARGIIEEDLLRIRSERGKKYTVASGNAFYSAAGLRPYVSVTGTVPEVEKLLPLVAAWQEAYNGLFRETETAWNERHGKIERQKKILRLYDQAFFRLADQGQWPGLKFTPEAREILKRFRAIYTEKDILTDTNK